MILQSCPCVRVSVRLRVSVTVRVSARVSMLGLELVLG